MCGAKLPASPAPAASQVPPATQKVDSAGTSMLGLAHEPSAQDRVAYLLQDDEPPPKSPLRFIIPIVILAAAAWAGWHWRDDIRTLIATLQGTPAQDATSTVSPPTSSDTSQPQPQAAPAPAANPPAPAPQASAPATSSTPAPQAAAPAPTDQGNNTHSQQSAQAPPAETQLGSSEPQSAPPADQAPAPSEARDQTAAATPQPSLPKAKPKPSPAQPAQEGDAQESEGEKYLYGNGVTADCGKASKNLLASARKGSAKAQSVVGSMYATGHCVSRDLPTAYGWFAKALHQDPNNRRYAGDLEVVWRQMTQAERQLALKAGQ